MSALCLRTLACALMLADHIGLRLGLPLLRAVGRLAFPIFAFLIANGLRHTADWRRYLLRLAVLAVLSQVPFSLCLYDAVWYPKLNVFVTLALGLLCLHLDDLARQTPWEAPLLAMLFVLCAALERVLPYDYGVRGVFLIVLFGRVDWGTGRGRLAVCCGFLALYYIRLWTQVLAGSALLPLLSRRWVELAALLSLPLLACYNGAPGFRPASRTGRIILQYSFYLFYPAHLLVLWAAL